ncbi:MAG: hypothetical protein U1B30_07445 [Pseudomonadota bacterium]|nr:hypothetical protein [Pseudomonadota bacterium]
MREYLIYTSAGKFSCLNKWVLGDRKFDLWVTNYSDQPSLWKEYADFYNETKGAKFPNFKRVFEANKALLKGYKAIMIADDDILISTERLNELFEFASQNNFTIVTPAFSRFGKISHATTARELVSDYRLTNFAEVTCPIFNADALMDFMEVYDPSLGECFGVDWWYLDFFKKNRADAKIAISDRLYCINPYEFKKGTLTREIDTHYSDAQRLQLWETMKSTLHIDTFEKEIYGRKKNSVFTLVKMAPLYYCELAFDKIYKQLRGNTLLRTLKRYYIKAKS